MFRSQVQYLLCELILTFIRGYHFDLAFGLQLAYLTHLNLLFFFRQGITNLKLVALTTTTNKKVLENLFQICPHYVSEITLI